MEQWRRGEAQPLLPPRGGDGGTGSSRGKRCWVLLYLLAVAELAVAELVVAEESMVVDTQGQWRQQQRAGAVAVEKARDTDTVVVLHVVVKKRRHQNQRGDWVDDGLMVMTMLLLLPPPMLLFLLLLFLIDGMER